MATLTGRQADLDRLTVGIRSAQDGASVIVVEGPAGIGKTSLLRAGLVDAKRMGFTILRASPLQSEIGYAYATLGDLLAAQLPDLAGRIAPTHLAALRRAFGAAPQDQVAVDPLGEAVDAVDEQLIATATLYAFRALAARQRLIVAIDDAPWVDQSSRAALSYALRRLGDANGGFVLTQRSDAAGGPLPFDLVDAPTQDQIRRIWLEPLSLGALQSVLQEATGKMVSRPTLIRIHQISGGNPFYAIELARAIAAQAGAHRPGEDLPLPRTLRDLVAGRLQDLPAAARRLLLVAALTTQPTVLLLKERGGASATSTLRACAAAGVIRIDGDLVAFAHPLFASILVADATVAERRAAHAWLGTVKGEDIEARARHIALAHTGPDPAVGALLAEAAAAARRRGAPSVAAELADLAVDRTPATDPDRSARGLTAADASFAAGDFEAARERVARMLPTLNGAQRARALTISGLATWYVGTAREAATSLEHALVDAAEDRELSGLIHYYLSIFSEYDLELAYRHSKAAAELLAGTSDRTHLAAALLQTFYIAVILGESPRLDLLEEGLKAELHGAPADRLTSPGMWWAGIGRLDLARDRFASLLEFDRIYGTYSNVSNLLTRQSEVELWADDWASARALANAALDADLETNKKPTEMAMRAVAMLDALEGELDLASAAAEAGVERCERNGELALASAWLRVTATVGASRNDPTIVEAATARAAHHLREVGFREPLRLDLAPERIEALAALGRLDEAEAELRDLEHRNRVVPKTWAAAAIARGTAQVALARGDLEAALAATNDVAEGEPADWSRFDTARTLLVRGEALRRNRARRAASEALRRSRAIFTTLGARAWTRKVDAETKRLGLQRTTTFQLTPTEARVARLAGDGLSTKEVASALGISPRTVETHLAGVYGKLGVGSRAELGRVMAGHPDTDP